eukprot:424534_1
MTTPTIQTSPFNTDRKYDTKFIFPMAKEDNDKTFIFPSNKYIDNSEEEDDDDHYYSNSDSVIVTEYSDASESHDINLVPGDELRMKIENELKEQEKQITQNNPEITNGGSYCEINIKYDAYDGKILKLKVHDSCLIYDIKLQIDNVTNNGNALNIQYNGNVLPNNQSLKELGIGADSLLIYSNEPEIDPIEWTESDVSNWFISFGYDEFAAEEWIQQRIDGAALLLNIRGGHIRFDALVEDKQDIQDIMEEVKYLRFNSIGYQKQEIVNLKNKIYNNQKTVNKQQLSELKISRNILEIDLRKSFQQIEEFEKKMKEMEKENNKLKYKNDDGFIYEFFLRIDFSNEGYSITQDKTIEFWNIFEAEKEIKRGYLEKSVKCKGTIDTLIEAIKYTDSQYNVITNNCQDVSKQIWEKMTKSIFHSMINTHNIKKSKS